MRLVTKICQCGATFQGSRGARYCPVCLKKRRVEARRLPINWEEIPNLGKIPDYIIAAQVNVDPCTVRSARKALGIPAIEKSNNKMWTEFFDHVAHLLGQVSDASIAKKLGVSHTWVARERRRRGIAPYQSKKKVDWDKWIGFLGKKSDECLARLIGCDRSTVGEKRKSLGIPPYSG